MPQDHNPGLAKVKIHPAIIVTAGVAGTFHFRNLWTIKTDSNSLAVDMIALVFIVAGIVILILAYFCMFKAQTTINPKKHTTSIVAVGIYKYSRNPIYLGWFVFLIGVGIKNLSYSSFFIALTMLVLLHWAVVLEEEKYLEEKFGDEYKRYKHSVRRWI